AAAVLKSPHDSADPWNAIPGLLGECPVAWKRFNLIDQLNVMARIIIIVLVGLATGLTIRAVQIHWEIWKAAESRKELLAHFVDHTKNLSEREVEEARFWSNHGDHSSKTFSWYLISGLFAAGAAD